VEALRYLQLEKTVNHKEHPSMVENMMSVLVLGDYLQKNTVAQMKLLQRAFQYIRIEVQFIVKPHPGCPILSEDYPGLEMLIVNKPIYQLLDKCMVVYTSAATSAAVDAYCFGKQVVTMLDPEDLNLSPLREKDNVIFITTELELAKALNNMDKVKDIVNQGSNYFYLDTTLPRWSDLLNLEDI
jgi:surface carbohydrate biosynthesis protein (TIGR04326 family)